MQTDIHIVDGMMEVSAWKGTRRRRGRVNGERFVKEGNRNELLLSVAAAMAAASSEDEEDEDTGGESCYDSGTDESGTESAGEASKGKMHIRKVNRKDLETFQFKTEWTTAEVFSLMLNAMLVWLVYMYFSEPLDPETYQKLIIFVGFAMIYSQNGAIHKRAQIAALKQIKDALVQFAQVEIQLYTRETNRRNRLAKDLNDLQQEIDDLKGFYFSWTSWFRRERIVTSTSMLERFAVRGANALGETFSSNLAAVIKTRGFGPIIFVCLPKSTESPTDFFTDVQEYTVYGVYLFGRLITRFSAATSLITMFPQTLESERLLAMRQDSNRIRMLINRKEQELNYIIKVKFGMIQQ